MKHDRVSGARADQGSALILGLGLVAMCLLAFAVISDASAALLQRHRLQSLADGAALAGAQAIDLHAYYDQGVTSATRLDPRRVDRLARNHLIRSITTTPAEGLAVDRVWTDGVRVVVGLSAPLDLPFLAELFSGDVRVESWAQLRYRDYRAGS